MTDIWEKSIVKYSPKDGDLKKLLDEIDEKSRDIEFLHFLAYINLHTIHYQVSVVKPPSNIPYPELKFICEPMYSNRLSPPDDTFLIGCGCIDGCENNPNCSCIDLNDGMPYLSNGYLNLSHYGAIYECNKKCECSNNCMYKMTQKPEVVPLELRYLYEKGWGVFSVLDIPKGQYITSYIGELIDSQEATNRSKHYTPEKACYFFDMDFFGELPSSYNSIYTVDASTYCNISHFFNHSCSPNMIIKPVLNNNPDIRIHNICFFAYEDIEKNKELTFDYLGITGRTDKTILVTRTPRKKRIKCLCNSNECRKWVYC